MKHPNDRIEALLSGLAAVKLPLIDLSLDRVTKLLSALGNPQDRLPPVVHVAGTNGKGSLLAYLTAILQVAGYRVHRYTSPHLVHFNERIMLAGREIDDAQLLPLLARVADHAKDYPVTFFEATTALAFLAFAEVPADIVLLEVGLGGRLDATNMVRTPMVTAITPISMDHTEYLGNTIAAIAAEKAGIIKPGVPCVSGPQEQEAAEVIERVANLSRASLYRYGKEWHVSEKAEEFQYRSAHYSATFPMPNLMGEHQIRNAATAVAVTECLKGFAITERHIAEGITHALWPARLQRLAQGKLAELLPAGSELWLDGGHNPSAGKVLAEWVKQQKKPVHLICGMLANKDIRQFLLPLAPYAKSLTAVPIEGESLAEQPQVISDVGQALGINTALSSEIRIAIEDIVKSNKSDFIILICGSLYLAGNILWQNGHLA